MLAAIVMSRPNEAAREDAMSYHINTYRDGLISWKSEVTVTSVYTPPDMALDAPRRKKERPPQEVTWEVGHVWGFTRRQAERRARRIVKKEQRMRQWRANATTEEI